MSEAAVQSVPHDETAELTTEVVAVGDRLWASVDPDATPKPSGDALNLLTGIIETLGEAGRMDVFDGATATVTVDTDGDLVAIRAGGTEYPIAAHPDLRDDGTGEAVDIAVYDGEIEVAPPGTH